MYENGLHNIRLVSYNNSNDYCSILSKCRRKTKMLQTVLGLFVSMSGQDRVVIVDSTLSLLLMYLQLFGVSMATSLMLFGSLMSYTLPLQLFDVSMAISCQLKARRVPFMNPPPLVLTYVESVADVYWSKVVQTLWVW